jgi:transposase
VLTLPASVRVFFALDPIDMRGSFDAIAGRVRALTLDPQDGHLCVFVNRRRTLMKILFFEATGWVLVAKRLERGTFQIPPVPEGASPSTLAIPSADLGLILEGVDLRALRRLRHRPGPTAQS